MFGYFFYVGKMSFNIFSLFSILYILRKWLFLSRKIIIYVLYIWQCPVSCLYIYTEAEAHLLNTKIPELAAVVTEQPLATKLVHCKESLPNFGNYTL